MPERRKRLAEVIWWRKIWCRFTRQMLRAHLLWKLRRRLNKSPCKDQASQLWSRQYKSHVYFILRFLRKIFVSNNIFQGANCPSLGPLMRSPCVWKRRTQSPSKREVQSSKEQASRTREALSPVVFPYARTINSGFDAPTGHSKVSITGCIMKRTSREGLLTWQWLLGLEPRSSLV